jgi:hypothetical protein
MRKALVCAVALIAAAAANAAPIVNGDFNNGLSGWLGGTGTTNSYPGFFGADPGPSPTGNPYGYQAAGAGESTQFFYQTFDANGGQWVSFNWFFSAEDYMPFDDDGFAFLFNFTTGTYEAFEFESVGTVGDFGTSGWKTFSAFIPTNGTYGAGVAVTNRFDSVNSSIVGLDGVRNPEPVSMLVFAGLLAGGGYLVRRRMKAAA